jgi:hypothetical protein
MATPFAPFKNSTLVFEVDDPDAPDEVDSAGNPKPVKILVTVEAYLRPAKAQYALRNNLADEFPGLNAAAKYMEGFITNNNGDLPIGINPNDRTVEATYRGQPGRFIYFISLKSSVEADQFTGQAINGKFEVLGGQ